MQLPENLGQIEFLREHPQILEKLIEHSRDKSLEPFILKKEATYFYGGFFWNNSDEGYDIWDNVMIGNTQPFYDFHAKRQKTDISQIRYHMEQIEALLKKMEAK